jgi:hypothetical protein
MADGSWARRFATGLSSFGSSLLRSLAAMRFNPSRCPVCGYRRCVYDQANKKRRAMLGPVVRK